MMAVATTLANVDTFKYLGHWMMANGSNDLAVYHCESPNPLGPTLLTTHPARVITSGYWLILQGHCPGGSPVWHRNLDTHPTNSQTNLQFPPPLHLPSALGQ